MGNVVHAGKSGDLLTGAEYEDPGQHIVTLTAADVGASAEFLIAHEVLSGAASSFPEIAVPSGLTRIWGFAFVKVSTAHVPRFRYGGSSIDTGNNYATSSGLHSSTTLVTQTSTNGNNLVHAALASGNQGLFEFYIIKPASGMVARLLSNGNYGSVAAGTAPLHNRIAGIWANTADVLARIELLGFTTLTGTTGANFDAGSELVVYGR